MSQKWPETWPQELPKLREAFQAYIGGTLVLILDSEGLLLHGLGALQWSVANNQPVEIALFTRIDRTEFERSDWPRLLGAAYEHYCKKDCKRGKTFFKGILLV
jgi:hypothetical protein